MSNQQIVCGELIPMYSKLERFKMQRKMKLRIYRDIQLFGINLFSVPCIATNRDIYVHKIWIKLKEKRRKIDKLNHLT
jgi:hypothetical protein